MNEFCSEKHKMHDNVLPAGETVLSSADGFCKEKKYFSFIFSLDFYQSPLKCNKIFTAHRI